MKIKKRITAIVMAVMLAVGTSAMSATMVNAADSKTYLDEVPYQFYSNATKYGTNTYSMYDGYFSNKVIEQLKCTRAMRFSTDIYYVRYPDEVDRAIVSATYNISGKYSRFMSELFTDHYSAPQDVKIYGDNNILFEKSITDYTNSTNIDINVQGVENLKIEVQSPMRLEVGAPDTIFNNAYFTGDTAPTEPTDTTTQPTQETEPTDTTTQPTQETEPTDTTTQPTQETEPTDTTTDPTDATTETDPTAAITTKATVPTTAGTNGGSATTNSNSASNNTLSGKVATGDNNTIVCLIIILALASTAVIMLRRRQN